MKVSINDFGLVSKMSYRHEQEMAHAPMKFLYMIKNVEKILLIIATQQIGTNRVGKHQLNAFRWMK